MSGLGEFVHGHDRRRRQGAFDDDAGILQVSQSRGEQVARYAGQTVQQVAVAAGSQRQFADDQETPSLADHVERPGEGAELSIPLHLTEHSSLSHKSTYYLIL